MLNTKNDLFHLILVGVMSCLVSGSAFAANDVTTLFSRVSTPESIKLERPLPAGAPQIRVDPDVHEQLRLLPIGGRVVIDIPLDQQRTVRAVLERYTVIDEHSVLTAMTTSGPRPIPAPKSVLLKGTIHGIDPSFVTLAVYPGFALGRIVLRDGEQEEYIFSPLTRSEVTTMAIVPATSLVAPDHVPCSVTDETMPVDRNGKSAEGVQAGTLRRMTLALEGDTPYYLDHGSNLAVATAYAEAVIAASSAIYERDVSATLYIGQLNIWTTTDPYPGTTSANLLTQFRDYWRANFNGVTRSSAMLLSGQNGIGGVAYLNTLCSKSNGYAVSGLNNNIVYPFTGYAWDTDVTSHELGHNIGSPHTHSCTWNPPIDSCYTAEGNCFAGTKAVRGTIMSYCHLTAMGTELKFHPLVSQLMQTRLAAASCVSIITDLDVWAGADTTICNGTSVTIRATISGGTSPFTITWTPATGMTQSTTLSPTVSPAVTTSYIIEIRDAFNATARDTITVVVNPRVNVILPIESTVCAGSPLNITIPSVGGTAPITYRWVAAGLDVTTPVPSLTFTPTTNGPLTVTAVDSKGCRDEKVTQVFVSPRPIVIMSEISDTLCTGTPVEVIANVSSGVPPYRWSWIIDGVQTSITSDRLQYLADSTHNIRVIATDALGCIDSARTTVNVHDVRIRIETNTIPIPAIPLCEKEFDAWVKVENYGNDTVRFSSFTSDGIVVTSRDLPLTLSPRTSFILPLRILLPPLQSISDTVLLNESVCNTSLPIYVSGDRGSIISDNANGSNSYLNAVACEVVQDRTLSLNVLNGSPASITVTSAYSRGFKSNLTLASTNSLIASKATKRLEFRGSFRASLGKMLDTIDVQYDAHGCKGSFVAYASVPTTDVNIQQPASITFDTIVSPALEDVVRTATIRVSATDVPAVTITGVSITGPFRSSLQPGYRVPTNTDHEVTIAFRPSLLAQDGLAGGELSYTIDSCIASDTIRLNARRTVVDVAEHDAGTTSAFVTVDRDRITIHHMYGELRIIDVQGREVHHQPVDGMATISIQGWPVGVYFCTVASAQGILTNRSFVRP